MDRLALLRARAERSRRRGFAEPVIADAADAVAVAADLADHLAGLEGRERLLFLAMLEDVRTALDGRGRKLEAEMAAHREALQRAGRGAAAARSYRAAAARPPRPRGG